MHQRRASSRLSAIAFLARPHPTFASCAATGTSSATIIHLTGTDRTTTSSVVIPWRPFAFTAQNGLSLPDELYPT